MNHESKGSTENTHDAWFLMDFLTRLEVETLVPSRCQSVDIYISDIIFELHKDQTKKMLRQRLETIQDTNLKNILRQCG